MRVKQKRWRDAQRRASLAECALCGGELYHGEAVWRLDGRVLCERCVRSWLREAGL